MNDAERKELLQLADEIVAVLQPLGGDGVERARALRESIEQGVPAGRALIEPVGDALLASLMKVGSAEVPASSVGDASASFPSRLRVREVYKKFRHVVQSGRIA
jgi:hypothetical protein